MKLIIFIWLYYLYCKRILFWFSIYLFTSFVKSTIRIQNSSFYLMLLTVNVYCLIKSCRIGTSKVYL